MQKALRGETRGLSNPGFCFHRNQPDASFSHQLSQFGLKQKTKNKTSKLTTLTTKLLFTVQKASPFKNNYSCISVAKTSRIQTKYSNYNCFSQYRFPSYLLDCSPVHNDLGYLPPWFQLTDRNAEPKVGNPIPHWDKSWTWWFMGSLPLCNSK